MRWLYVVALTLLAIGCGDVTAPSPMLSVTVQVRERQGVPISGARVTVNERFIGVTDRAGELLLRVSADFDVLCVNIAAAGYRPLTGCQSRGWLGGGWSFWLDRA